MQDFLLKRNISSNQKWAADVWEHTMECLVSYVKKPGKIDMFKEEMGSLDPKKRHACSFLLSSVIRNKYLIDSFLDKFLKRSPRPKLYAILAIGAGELLSRDSSVDPKIIDFSVSFAKKNLSIKESGLVNAVLRKLRPFLKEEKGLDVLYSHPKWLIDRWITQFGEDNALEVLKWNQEPPEIYFRRSMLLDDKEFSAFKKTKWDFFFAWSGDDWGPVKKNLQSGAIYVQDPSTFEAPRLLNAKPGEKILDLCAAPGGKSRIIAEQLLQKPNESSLLVAIDMKESRMKLLRENMEKVKGLNYHICDQDIYQLSVEFFDQKELPQQFDGVLLDAPCSNTGVLRRRPDAKWRLNESAIAESAIAQGELLDVAAQYVKPGGRLVYSTCSIEATENQEVIDSFLSKNKVFRLEKAVHSYPWESGYDGGGAFLLTRSDKHIE